MNRPKINVRLATDQDRLKWDGFVSSAPDAGPYHRYAWRTAVEQGYGHKGYYLLAEKETDGSPMGVLPLICFKMPWGRKSLISLPYCDYAGVVGAPATRELLLKRSLRLAKDLGISGVEHRCAHEETELGGNGVFSTLAGFHKSRMLLPLPDSSKLLWSGFKSKLRSQVSRPQKEGLSARLGGKELIDDFYQVFCLNMRDLGSPVHARQWFDVLVSEYGSSAKVGVVYLKTGEPSAAGILLTSKQKVAIPWASSLREHNRLAPNMLLYWSFLQWATDSGFKNFDFGRSTPGEGTYRFKEQWGAKPEPLFWLGSPQSKESVPNEGKGRTVGLRELAENVWQQMPLPLANAIGSSVRGFISL